MNTAPPLRDAIAPAFESNLRNGLLACALLLVALATLLIGTPLTDPRLVVSGAPGPAIAFLLAAAILVSDAKALNSMVQLLPFTLFIVPLAFSLFWSPDPEYGAYKLFGLLTVFLLATPLLISGIKLTGFRLFFQLWIWVMLALLCLALLYKARYGFFDREVLFLLNGPIVFARLMGIAAILSIFLFAGILRYLLFLVFGLAVLWTMSKGPILALVAAAGLACWLLPRGERLRFAMTNLLILGSLLALNWRTIAALDLGRLQLLSDLILGNFSGIGSELSSTGVRLRMFQETLALIADRPMGVGLGAWSESIRENWGLDYPHNLVLELWSEGGILLGSLALLPFIAFLGVGHPAPRAVACFLLAAQMVSGDLLDARYLMVFSALSFFRLFEEDDPHPATIFEPELRGSKASMIAGKTTDIADNAP